MINASECVRNYYMLKHYFVYFSGSASVCGKYLHIQFLNLKEKCFIVSCVSVSTLSRYLLNTYLEIRFP